MEWFDWAWKDILSLQETESRSYDNVADDGYEIIEQPDSTFSPDGYFWVRTHPPLHRHDPGYWYDAERPY